MSDKEKEYISIREYFKDYPEKLRVIHYIVFKPITEKDFSYGSGKETSKSD